MFVFQLVPNFGPPSYGQVLSFVSHSFIGGETLVFPPMSIREISSYIFTFVDYCGQQLGEPKIRSFFCVFFLSPVLSIGREISVVECIKIFTELSRVAANGRSEKEGKPQPGKNIKRKKNSSKEEEQKAVVVVDKLPRRSTPPFVDDDKNGNLECGFLFC